MLGPSNIVGVPRNHLLLRERIVDGWVAGLPDLPTAADSDLTATVLSRMPVFFTCAADHPLREKRTLTYSDIAAYPSLALPPGSYPRVEAALRAIGLWNDGVRMTRYQRDRWEGRSEEELVVGYGTPLSMRISGGSLCRLPLLLPFRSGDAVVTLREHHNKPRLQEVLSHLHGRLRELAQQEPEIELLPLP
jgi:DNA-binding transcriptional LysR family regulator